MSNDIVTRLRNAQLYTRLHGEAADAIEALREENRLVGAQMDEFADEIERLRAELAVVVADRAAAISRAEALERDRDALDDTLCDIANLLGCRANTTEPIEAVKSVIAEIERLREALSHANRMQRETQDARTSDVRALADEIEQLRDFATMPSRSATYTLTKQHDEILLLKAQIERLREALKNARDESRDARRAQEETE